jgi:hypothetical protein
MTTETHISFAVDCREYLQADGGLGHDTPDFLKEPAFLLGFYRAMVLTRTFDNKAIALQRTGQQIHSLGDCVRFAASEYTHWGFNHVSKYR